MTRRRVHPTLTAAILAATLSTTAAAASAAPSPAGGETPDRERSFLTAAAQALLTRLGEVFAPVPAAEADPGQPVDDDPPEPADGHLAEGPSIDPVG